MLRIFERGGRFRPEVGIPEREEESGRPRTRLSNRGLGTENRTDPVFIGLQKTRLLRSDAEFPRHERSSGRLSLQRLHGLPRGLCQRSLAGAFRAVRDVRQSRHRRSTPIR